jgi:DNA repair protein RecO (recombination protein O)
VLTKTEGIVLKSQPYTEADLIITYLTLDRGVFKAFAKSPRKIKSRFGSSLEPLTHAKISFMGKEQSMPRVTQSDILTSYQDIRENLYDFIHISRLAEIFLSLTTEGIPNKKLFLFFLNVMNILKSSEQKQKEVLRIIFQIRLLSAMGYAPRLHGCGKCGAKSLDFYPHSGTTLCSKCYLSLRGKHENPMKISHKTVHFYLHSIQWPIKTSGRLRPSLETLSELSSLLEAHLTFLLSKKLLTTDFLAKV